MNDNREAARVLVNRIYAECVNFDKRHTTIEFFDVRAEEIAFAALERARRDGIEAIKVESVKAIRSLLVDA